MAGVDLRTIQVLGGLRTLAMVQRYSHLGPDHLLAAVERLVPPTVSESDSTRMQRLTPGEPTQCIVSVLAPVAQLDRASAF
jgi:hypothetical protein